MPRALRLESENASYHVINRGNYRGPVFAAASTKRAFLRCLAEACQKTGWLVHAWTLMTNHFHLAFTTPGGRKGSGCELFGRPLSRRADLLQEGPKGSGLG